MYSMGTLSLGNTIIQRPFQRAIQPIKSNITWQYSSSSIFFSPDNSVHHQSYHLTKQPIITPLTWQYSPLTWVYNGVYKQPYHLAMQSIWATISPGNTVDNLLVLHDKVNAVCCEHKESILPCLIFTFKLKENYSKEKEKNSIFAKIYSYTIM